MRAEWRAVRVETATNDAHRSVPSIRRDAATRNADASTLDASKLFAAADTAGDGDGSVDRGELKATIDTFDVDDAEAFIGKAVDPDGLLDTGIHSELHRFDSAFGPVQERELPDTRKADVGLGTGALVGGLMIGAAGAAAGVALAARAAAPAMGGALRWGIPAAIGGAALGALATAIANSNN